MTLIRWVSGPSCENMTYMGITERLLTSTLHHAMASVSGLFQIPWHLWAWKLLATGTGIRI